MNEYRKQLPPASEVPSGSVLLMTERFKEGELSASSGSGMVLRDGLWRAVGGQAQKHLSPCWAVGSSRPAGGTHSTKMDSLSISVLCVSTLCLAKHISGVLFLSVFQKIVSCADQ